MPSHTTALIDGALVSPRQPDDRWELARQVGVRRAVIHLLEAGDDETRWTIDGLLGTKNWLENAGLGLAVMAGERPITGSDSIGVERPHDGRRGQFHPGYQTKGPSSPSVTRGGSSNRPAERRITDRT